MNFFRGKVTGGDQSPSSSFSRSASLTSVTGPARPIRFVYCDDDGKFLIDPQALAVLQLIKDPIGVVAVCGRARQGKSFILNQLLGRSSGFQVASTHRPCTKGLWLWSTPLKRTALDGTDYSLILLDSEGIDAYDQTGTYSTQIFSLAVLLSSMFIYNQMGGIDEASLDRLSLVTEMTKHIRVRVSGGTSAIFELGQFSPIFVWLLRDFYLDLVEDNRKITPRDYLEIALRPVQGSGKDMAAKNEIRDSIRALFPDRECFTLVRPLNSETELQQLDQKLLDKLRPEFRSGLDELTRFVFDRTRPKQVGATIMNGPILAGITQSFLDALNNGAVPTITSSWQSVEETECRRAYNSATEVYDSSFDKPKATEEAVLREVHEEAMHNALATFNMNAVGAGSARHKYDKLLQKNLKKTFEGYKRNACMDADLQCSNAIQNMEKRLRAACHAPDAKLEQLLKVVDGLLSEYETSCHGPRKDKRQANFLQQSLEGPIFDLAKKQIVQLESENSAVRLKFHSMEDRMALLSKQLEASENQKSEYLKRYEDAINDKKKIGDDYMNRITNLESKCSSVEERYYSVSKAFDSAKKESSEWKKKYELILSRQKAEEEETSVQIAVLKSKRSAAEASVAAVREQAHSAQEEADEWKRKYGVAVKETKSALEKAAAVLEHANKNVQLREDALRAEFSKTLADKTKELKEKVAQMDHAERQLATLTLRLKAAESKVKNYDMEGIELKLEIREIAEKLEASNAVAMEYEREVKLLEQEKIHLEEKYASQFARFDDLQERCTSAEREANRASEIADKAQSEVKKALKEKSDIQQISMERLACIEKVERLIESLERQKTDLSEEVATLRASSMDAKAKIASLKGRIEEREKEIESLMKSNNEQRADTVEALDGLLESERNSRTEASRRAEDLSFKLQATQHKLDLVQQELTSVRLNESALDAKLKTASHGKRPRVEDIELRVDSDGIRKKAKSTSGSRPFHQGDSPEDGQERRSEDHTKFSLHKLKQELVKHDYGAELLRLLNPSKTQVLSLYERYILRRS